MKLFYFGLFQGGSRDKLNKTAGHLFLLSCLVASFSPPGVGHCSLLFFFSDSLIHPICSPSLATERDYLRLTTDPQHTVFPNVTACWSSFPFNDTVIKFCATVPLFFSACMFTRHASSDCCLQVLARQPLKVCWAFPRGPKPTGNLHSRFFLLTNHLKSKPLQLLNANGIHEPSTGLSTCFIFPFGFQGNLLPTGHVSFPD